MKKKSLLLMVFILIIGFFVSCGNKPDASVAEEVMPDLYDNGKNIGWINTSDSTETIRLLQKWIDEHPHKRIIALSADGSGPNGQQNGWMFIYEKRER